jgi:alkaline phosphatase
MPRLHIHILLCGLLLAGATAPSIRAQDRPKNLILLIGDGMGVAHLSALRLQRGSTQFDRFRVAGFSATSSANRLTTESAAAATALATGYRTNNGYLAVAPDGRPLRTILEHADSIGMATGLIATSSITHATPAAFYAHIARRDEPERIAEQAAGSSVALLIGGGRDFFLTEGAGGRRSDGRDLVQEMQARGFTYATEPGRSADTARRLLWLLARDGVDPAGKRPYGLADLTRAGLKVLSRGTDGFFLMIEGSQIDWAGHDKDFPQLLREMEDFDAAVGAALDYSEKNPGTLVVVLADHETGGLTLAGKQADASDLTGNWSLGDHTPVLVPVFAAGPGAAAFGGIHENLEIGRLLFRALDATAFPVSKKH